MTDAYQIEKLEDRMLLAVGVSFKAKKGILVIKGDGASDEVDVVGTGTFGEVDVYVNDVFVATFASVKTIKANMGAGDDDLGFDAIQIGGSIVAKMGSGADEFDIDTFNEFDDIDGDVFIGGSVKVNMGNNAGDFVNIDSEGGGFGLFIGNNMTLAGAADVDLDGEGGSSAIESNDITIGGFLKIHSKVAGDVDGDGHTIDLDDVNVGGVTIIRGTSGVDDVEVTDSSFARRVQVALGGGDDHLHNGDVAGEENSFGSRVVVNGGGGFDTLFENAANVYAIPPVVRNFELII